MGICSSCLRGQDRHDSESSRLLDDDLYQSGYNYGTVQPQRHCEDTEDVKREREALDAICQKASDSVIDIWAVQPHPFAPNAPSPRPPSSDQPLLGDQIQSPLSPTATSSTQDQQQHQDPDSARHTASPVPGEFGGMKYVAYHDTPSLNDLSGVPKHWGEVVMTSLSRSGKRAKNKRPAINGNAQVNGEGGYVANEVFEPLLVR